MPDCRTGTVTCGAHARAAADLLTLDGRKDAHSRRCALLASLAAEHAADTPADVVGAPCVFGEQAVALPPSICGIHCPHRAV